MRTPRSILKAVCLAYLAFVVYGSLVPLHFRPLPLKEAVVSFRAIEYLHLGIASRADWVSNILLFIPLSFLAMGVLNGKGMARRVFSSVAVMLGLVALSGAIEFTQLFFPPRTVSINDIIAESIGAALGITAWWIWGKRFLVWLEGWQQAHGPTDVTTRILWAYLALLFGYNLLPLDLTISPVELYHKWHEGRVRLVPFAFLANWDIKTVYNAIADTAIWIPVAALLLMTKKRTVKEAWLWTVLLATLVEVLQLFVWTRVTDVNQILESVLGGGMGAWLAGRFVSGEHAAVRSSEQLEENRSAWGWIACYLCWSLVLLVVFWYPFDFHTDYSFLKERIVLLKRVPFYAYYYGTEYRAATELLHRLVFFAPLGALAAACIQKGRRSGLADAILCLIPCGLVILLIEGGRFLIPSKNPDTIDPLLELAGAFVGFWLVRAVSVRTKVKHNTSSSDFSPHAQAPATIARQSRPGFPGRTVMGKLTGGQLVLLCGAPLVFCLVGSVAMSFSGVPYNVRKIFGGGHPVLTLFMLCFALYWLCGVPVWFRVWLSRGSWLRVPAFPLLVILHGAVCYTLLRLSVPVEMIHKIVGSPVLGWPWEWELIGRFLALFAIPSMLMTGALLPVPLGAGVVRDVPWRWLAVAAVLLPLAHWVVVIEADTDNLVELMAGGGTWFSSILLGGWLYVVFQTGTILAARVAGHWRVSMTAALVFVVFSIPLCYALLWAGTENDIYKYEKHFSAMQFMLSPDREHYLGGGGLAVRYSVVHLLAVGVICATQLTAMKLLGVFQGKRQRIRPSQLKERA